MRATSEPIHKCNWNWIVTVLCVVLCRMAEQQLLHLNKEAAEMESNIHAALAELKATTDPDMKQIWQREYTRLVGEKEQLQVRRKELEKQVGGVFLPVIKVCISDEKC
eukprot:jgi/Chrzof1/2927/Cz12g04090.t1